MKNREKLNFNEVGQWSIDTIPEDSLEKKLKNFAAAAALLGSISNISLDTLDKPQKDTPSVSKEKQLHPDLNHIAFIESNSGKNLKHPTVNYGLNAGHRAGGQFGMMPITAKETVKKNPSLRDKYSHILNASHTDVTKFLNNNSEASKEIASAHFDRLLRIFPKDSLKRAYAWNNGISGAMKASKEEIVSHPYVRKFVDSSKKRSVASDNSARD
jgi:hypothetical protein